MNKFSLKLVDDSGVSVSGSGEHFKQFLFLPPNTDDSSYHYGREKLAYETDDVVKLRGMYGSIRYLFKDKDSNRFVGGLQLVKNTEIVVLSTIFTEIAYRNRGIATALINRARKEYGKRLVLSNHFTEQGATFFKIAQDREA